MKMAAWFLRYTGLLSVLLGLALLGACGGDTNEDLTAPSISMDAIDPSTFTTSRTLSGTIEAGAELDVLVSTGATVGEIIIEDDGTWRCTISDLAVGSNLVTVSASDSHGNTSSLQFILEYNLLRIDQADTLTAQTSSIIHGRLAPGATIDSVTLNGPELDPVPFTPLGDDAFILTVPDLVEGTNSVNIIARNDAGETQPIPLSIGRDGNAVSLDINKPPIPINVQSYTLSGTVQEGWTVDVSVEEPLREVPQAEVKDLSMPTEGSWEVTIDNLKKGDSIIRVTAKQGEETTSSSAWTRIVVAPETVQ